ncbi:MAG: hypothetical protein KGD64_10180 [Candidatus Heimdallarchaeota archaeon]|nr:hypothetical protein [Candidatus Heimdallarchaeota archaeon]
MTEILNVRNPKPFKIHCSNIQPQFLPWIEEAENRIFSLSAGNRIAPIAEDIMKVGFAKILFAANELGSDIDTCKPFVLFAPDGTCTYNKERFSRGFAYGCLIKAEFDGLIATQNAMPNGCGFSLFELKDFSDDENLAKDALKISDGITENQALELGRGNHFIAIYHVKDKLSGEDTGRRFVILHCSGHELNKEPLYFQDWLEDVDGYNKIHTPHGSVWLLEKESKRLYLDKFSELEKNNEKGRSDVMKDLFDGMEFELISDLTHQGLEDDGKLLKLGIQTDKDQLLPIAFNPDEGALTIKIKPNLNRDFLDRWKYAEMSNRFGYNKIFENLDIIPHGAGYEFVKPIRNFSYALNKQGIENFTVEMERSGGIAIKETASSFREIRQYMSYKRKLPIMQKLFEADLGDHIHDLIPLIQIHPKRSIPGGEY